MDNLTVIQNPDPSVIRSTLDRMGVDKAHFTNGVFAGRPDVLLPTNLACFKMIDDQTDDGAFIIAVNSDKSVGALNEAKKAKGEDIPAAVPQDQRAGMIGKAVASVFPNREVIVVFYDEETPVELYTALKTSGFGMETLFKGNYGVDPNQGKIEGADLFRRVIAFPLPFQTASILPYAAGVTAKGEVTDNVEVLKLTDTIGDHGRAYMTQANKVLFNLPRGLQSLVDNSIKPQGLDSRP